MTPEDDAEAGAFVLRLAANGRNVVLIVEDEDGSLEVFQANEYEVYRLCDEVTSQYWRGAGETIN